MDIHSKLTDAGYTYHGNTSAGDRYTRGDFSVYHSGHLLIFLRCGLGRSFPEDSLESVSVQELERRSLSILRRFDMKEETASYDYGRKF